MDYFHNQEIPVIIKTYDLYKLYYGYLELFPKKDKYALGKKCEEQIIELLELILTAKSAPPDRKKTATSKASVKLDMLKIFIRLGQDLKLLDRKKYLAIENHLQEIGRMIGGWQKSI